MDSEMITMADACATLIKTEENTSLTFAEKDYLHRAEFVDNVFKIVEHLSDNNSCTTFAIDGAWGCGKSFVLNMLQDKLLAEQVDKEDYTGDRYVVFHYNSWKYDYYDEPLIAIVSAILDSIERNKFISTDVKEKVRKTIGVLASVGGIICKAGCGIDPVEEFKKIPEEWRSETSEQAKYDPYYVFKEVLKKLKATLADIAKKQTVVVIVDELDRCLPEYAIKVMERLHHITENMENIVVVMAIDKEQLKESVKKAFGFEKTELYLKKFIQFEIGLDTGILENTFFDNYPKYRELFEQDDESIADVEEFIRVIFDGIDNRKRQQMIEKTYLVHKLLFSDLKKKDYVFMSMELLLVVLIDYYGDVSLDRKKRILGSDAKNPFGICERSNKSQIGFSVPLSDYFCNKLEKISSLRRRHLLKDEFNSSVVTVDNKFFEKIYYYWVMLHNYEEYGIAKSNSNILYVSALFETNHKIDEYYEFSDYLKIIK